MASNAENVSIWWRHHGKITIVDIWLRWRSVWRRWWLKLHALHRLSKHHSMRSFVWTMTQIRVEYVRQQSRYSFLFRGKCKLCNDNYKIRLDIYELELALEIQNCLFDNKNIYKHHTIPHTIHDSMICCRKTLIKVLSAPLAQGPPVGTKMHKKALYHEVSIFWERWQVKHTHTLHGTEHQRRNKQENNTYGTYKKWWTGDDIWLVLRHMVAVAGVAEDLQGRLGENQQIMYKKFVCVDYSVFICYVLVYI